MIQQIPLANILFLDIETVPAQPAFTDLDEQLQQLWERKSSYFRSSDQTAEEVYTRAGIYAEFGKIVCISVGHVSQRNNQRVLRIKSFYDDDERKLLLGFNELLHTKFSGAKHYLCGHNGKEFDFPYIARRNLVNGLPNPALLDTPGKKPWEVNHLDTLELWKFGDIKHYTSLELLAKIFQLPTPKNDISGADVGRVYYQENDLERIARYCEGDVVTTVQLFLKYRTESSIPDNQISVASNE